MPKRPFLSGLLSLPLVFVIATTLAAQTEPGSAPAPIAGERNLHLLALPLLDFAPPLFTLPPPGKIDLRLSSVATSTWSHSWHPVTVHRLDFGRDGEPFSADEAQHIHERWPDDAAFLADGALLRTSLDLRIGLAAGWGASLEVPWIGIGDVRLDRLVEGFHGSFGISDAGRDAFPRDRFVVFLQPPGGEPFFVDRIPSDGIGDLVATLSWRGTLSDGWSIGGDLAAEAPTGDEGALRGSGSWDFGARMAIFRNLAPWSGHAELALVRPGGAGHLPGLEDSTFGRVAFSVGRLFGKTGALSLSASWSQSPFRGERLGTLSEDSAEMALGVTKRFDGGWEVRGELVENLPLLGGERADIGFVLRLARTPAP